MFEGTTFLFKLLYFFTAMVPAYILFHFQNHQDYLAVVGFILIGVAIGIKLKMMLQNRANKKQGVGDNRYKLPEIININGDITSFLLGVIIPSVIDISDTWRDKMMIFLGCQLLLFILMTRSSSIFSNVILILLGTNIFEMENGDYIISLSSHLAKKTDHFVSVRRLGDSEFCNTYIKEENE